MAFTGRLLRMLCWTLASLSCLTKAQAQDLSSKSVPVDLGVSTQVNTMFQDKTGFIWLGTNSGLYKYDGYTCLSYSHIRGDSSSIGDNAIYALYEDRAGILWVGTGKGLEKFDGINGTFRHFRPNPRAPERSESNSVRSIGEDRNGVLWVGTLSGLHQFDRAKESFTEVPLADTGPIDLPLRAVLAIYEDKEGALYLGTNAGLLEYDSTSKRFMPCLSGETAEVLSILKDDNGILWLGTSAGLKAYSPKERSCATYRYTPDEGHNAFVLSNEILSVSPSLKPGSLWIVTARGGFTFDKESKTFAPWDVDASNLCFERSGTLLLATRTGVKRFLQTKSPFRECPIGRSPVTLVATRPGVMWCFGSGWIKFDQKAERSVPYSFGSEQLFYVFESRHAAHMAFLKADGTFCIRDSLGKQVLHLGTQWEGMYRSMSLGCITKKGAYIGTQDGRLFLLDPRDNTVSELLNLKQWVCWIHEYRPGLLLIATLQGRLIRLDQAKGTYTEFIPDRKNPSSWGGSGLNWLYQDNTGKVWIATSDGLERYDPDSNAFTHFTEENGLLGNNVRGVWGDDHGYLWISSTKGISKLDPKTGAVKNYDASYGFSPHAGGFYGGVLRAENGELVMAGQAGLIRFHPDSVRDNLFVPPVVITASRIFDRPAPITNNIHLSYNENFLSFEFAALSYISPERNQYAYKMEGVDRDWVHSGTRRYVYYANLDPGEYVFRVKGSNNEGVWNEAGTSVTIVITPPWWKTRWAYGFYALAVLTVLYATWQLQMRRVKIRHAYEMTKFEAEKLREVDDLKSRFFANISHEFRTPLTLILGPVKQLVGELQDGEAKTVLKVVHKNASRLLDLVNQLLDLSKLESGNMKLQAARHDLVALIKCLLQSFCPYAERKTIALRFRSTEEVIEAYIDRDKIEKIITNVLSNAFKFTPDGGQIEASITRNDAHVSICITDTGIGIPKDKIPLIFDRFYQVDGSHTREQEGTGIGLSLTRELVELHKGTITVESEEGRGSAFTVRLPLGKAHLKAEEICEPEEEVKELPVSPIVPGDTKEIKHRKTTPGTAKQAGRPVLLVVEDNSDVRQYIRRNLESEYSILEARDGDEGLTVSVKEMPDIIISDVMMPKKDGFVLCGELKSDERTSHIPIILLTAKAASRDKIEGFATGADDYIMKPFEPLELKARLTNLLEQRKRLHEHFRKHGLFEVETERVTPVDQRFIERLMATITDQMQDPSFGVERLAGGMAVSRSLLLKKVEALIGESPVALIRRTRLNKAANLIESGFGNIFQVALEVGFSNPSYFTECFRKQFGVNPSDYLQRPG